MAQAAVLERWGLGWGFEVEVEVEEGGVAYKIPTPRRAHTPTLLARSSLRFQMMEMGKTARKRSEKAEYEPTVISTSVKAKGSMHCAAICAGVPFQSRDGGEHRAKTVMDPAIVNAHTTARFAHRMYLRVLSVGFRSRVHKNVTLVLAKALLKILNG